MSATGPRRVVLAGTGTPGVRQHHQRDMYLPAVRAMDAVEVVGVLAGGDADRSAELADLAGVPVLDPAGGPAEADLVILCPDVGRPEQLADLLSRCTDAAVPVLMDKPTLLDDTTLAELAAWFPTVVPAFHPRFHPALTSARARVATGGLGLLHAVHGELLVGSTDGPHPRGELRNLAVYALDVVAALLGELRGRAHAVIAPPGPDSCGESLTLSLRCEPDVVVTLLVGRAGEGTGASMLHRYRVLGSHGQLLVDLDSPAVELVGSVDRIPFGPSAIEQMIAATLAGATRTGLTGALALARVIAALEQSARERAVVPF
ncbi:MAG: hypothetical protein INR72_16290 [Williamsia herbipolensis]|nr:hypothetical protein [Williamsia herbipolensis]